MRVAVSHYSYYGAYQDGRLSLAAFIHEAARIGAHGVELLSPLYRDPVADKAEAKQALAETGLPCPIFSVSNNFAKLTSEERQEQLDRIKFGVDEAVDFGAGVVRVFAGDVAEGITFDQARTWIVEGLVAVSAFAQSAGVKLALENHGTLAGRGDQVVGLVQDVRAGAGNDAFGANPDFGNFVIVDEDPAHAVAQIAPYAYMAHGKDFRPGDSGFQSIAGKFWEGTVIGEGTVPVAACLDHLRGVGFEGWVSVEYEGAEDCMTAVPRSVASLIELV